MMSEWTTLPSDEERTMLRDAVRGLLARDWPPGGPAPGDGPALAALWHRLCEQGLAALCTDPVGGAVREALVVMEELGRASCQAPMLAAVLANLALWGRGPAAPPEAVAFLEALHGGTMIPAWSFSPCDPDGGAGGIAVHDGRARGDLNFVEAAAMATHLLVTVPDGLVVVAKSDAVSVEPSRAMGIDGLSRVRLAGAPAWVLPLAPAEISDLMRIARLGHAARALGAAQRAFDLAVEWAKERHQFGQPIGRFQAVQHKLADGLMALEGVRLVLDNAAAHRDRGVETWRVFADAAFAAADRLRRQSLETHHVLGAIGYAEEHEAPRHTKRAHLDLLRLGGARAARDKVAAYFLDGSGHDLPEYDLGEAGNAFRQEVRAWLAEHWSGERKAAYDALPFKQREYDAAFARAIGATGWIGMSWPREYGGQERGPFEQLAFIEEMERAEAPRIGAPVQAAMLMIYGTATQKAELLPEILRGEAVYGMGYSEPQAGSDLAAMRTKAVRDGDEWVINGQKIWTTTYWGQYMFLAARTDPQASPPHAGISMFIVPMDTPGITIKPSTTMYDGAFANIFYDDVRIPAENIVGPVNGGWKVLTGALGTERGFIGGGIVTKVGHAFDLLCAHVRGTPALRDDPLIRDRIATLAVDIEVGRQMMVRCAAMIENGETPLHDAAMSKVFSGELMERFGETALEILGMGGTVSEGGPGAILRGRFEQNLRHSLMWVISIGTNEIQRSLIAQRGLGLPR